MRETDYQQMVLDLARRVEDLELYHWRPPHGYAIVCVYGDNPKWVWEHNRTNRSTFEKPLEQSSAMFDNQLDCIKDLKAHLAGKDK